MTQTELTIAFVLGIEVYLVIYFIIGFISFSSVCIFAIYHIIFRRSRTKMPIRVKECLVLIYPSALYGIYLTMIPTGIILFLELVIMGGQIHGSPLNFFGCNQNSDPTCQLSIFDSFSEGLSMSDALMSNLRNGRCALATVIVGLYMMYTGAILLVPESEKKIDKKLGQVSFDGNIWAKSTWERSYFLFFYLSLVIVMVVIINWSLSNNFGQNVWYYLVTLKILGMITESVSEKWFSKKHLLAPITTSLDCVLDLATLGANDFFQFMLSFYWEQGIQMIERTYMGAIIDYSEEFLISTFSSLKSIIIASWEKNQIEDQEENNQDYMSARRNEISLSNSNIVLSDNLAESFESENLFELVSQDSFDEYSNNLGEAQKFSENTKKISSVIKNKLNFQSGKKSALVELTKMMKFQLKSSQQQQQQSNQQQQSQQQQQQMQQSQSQLQNQPDHQQQQQQLEEHSQLLNPQEQADFMDSSYLPGLVAAASAASAMAGAATVKSGAKVIGISDSFQEIGSDFDTYESILKSMLEKKIVKQELARKQQTTAADAATNHLIKQKERLEQEALMKTLKTYEKHHDNESIDTSSDECIESYNDFANDMIGFLVLPVIVMQCWIFYDQNSLGNDYNIAKGSFVYYFLWSITIIPFRIAIDIIYFHVEIVYSQVDFSLYAQQVKTRFQNRTKFWVASEDTTLPSAASSSSSSKGSSSSPQSRKGGNSERLESEDDKESEEEGSDLKELDRWCFSSQYFFVQTLFLIGMMQCTIGLYNIMSQKYNLFLDQMLLPIILTWYLICVLVHKLCIVVGKFIGVWRLKERQRETETAAAAAASSSQQVEGAEAATSKSVVVKDQSNNLIKQDMTDLSDQNSRARTHAPNDNQKEKKLEIVMNIEKKKQEDAQAEKQKHFQTLALNLERTQFENISFRKNFILSNKQWLRSNISKILNKETKTLYRDIIIEQMELIDEKLQQNRNLKKYLLMKKLQGFRRSSDSQQLPSSNLKHRHRRHTASSRRKGYTGTTATATGKHDEFSETVQELEEDDGDIEDANENDDADIDDEDDDDDDDDIEFDDADDLLRRGNRDRYSTVAPIAAVSLAAQVKPNRPTEIPLAMRIILRYWLYRSKNSKKALGLIGGIVDRNIKKECAFCGTMWGLICQTEQNVEDLFLAFLRKHNLKNVFTDRQKDAWQDYFQSQCQFRTECLSCNIDMTDHFYKTYEEQQKSAKLAQQQLLLQQEMNAAINNVSNVNRKVSRPFIDEMDYNLNFNNTTNAYLPFIYNNEFGQGNGGEHDEFQDGMHLNSDTRYYNTQKAKTMQQIELASAGIGGSNQNAGATTTTTAIRRQPSIQNYQRNATIQPHSPFRNLNNNHFFGGQNNKELQDNDDDFNQSPISSNIQHKQQQQHYTNNDHNFNATAGGHHSNNLMSSTRSNRRQFSKFKLAANAAVASATSVSSTSGVPNLSFKDSSALVHDQSKQMLLQQQQQYQVRTLFSIGSNINPNFSANLQTEYEGDILDTSNNDEPQGLLRPNRNSFANFLTNNGFESKQERMQKQQQQTQQQGILAAEAANAFAASTASAAAATTGNNRNQNNFQALQLRNNRPAIPSIDLNESASTSQMQAAPFSISIPATLRENRSSDDDENKDSTRKLTTIGDDPVLTSPSAPIRRIVPQIRPHQQISKQTSLRIQGLLTRRDSDESRSHHFRRNQDQQSVESESKILSQQYSADEFKLLQSVDFIRNHEGNSTVVSAAAATVKNPISNSHLTLHQKLTVLVRKWKHTAKNRLGQRMNLHQIIRKGSNNSSSRNSNRSSSHRSNNSSNSAASSIVYSNQSQKQHLFAVNM